PNVKGWPGGKAWLNTATLLERANLAESVAMGTLWADRVAAPDRSPPPAVAFDLRRLMSTITSSIIPRETPEEPAPPRAFDSARIVLEEQVNRPKDVVRALLDLHLPGGVRPETRAKLEAFIAQGSPKGPDLDRRVREAVHAILALAEYQLC